MNTSKQLQVGDYVRFNYMKEIEHEFSEKNNMQYTDYTKSAQQYAGTITDVRDLDEHPLSERTIAYGTIKGRRSRFLYTVEADDGTVQTFYDGRMMMLYYRPEKSKRGFIKRLKSALRRRSKKAQTA